MPGYKGGCGLAVGPGAALALANKNGTVSHYLPAPAELTKAALAKCPLTVVDLGAVPIGPATARAAAERADAGTAPHGSGAARGDDAAAAESE